MKDKYQTALNLKLLFNSKEWESLAELAEELRKVWTYNQNKFSLGASIEVIAIERVKWASMISGLDQLFVEINNQIETLKNKEDEEDSSVHIREMKEINL